MLTCQTRNMVLALFRGKPLNLDQCKGHFPVMESIHVAEVVSKLNPAGSFNVNNHIIRVEQHLTAKCTPGCYSYQIRGGLSDNRNEYVPVGDVNNEHMIEHTSTLNSLYSASAVNCFFVKSLGLPVSSISAVTKVQTSYFNLRKFIDW